MYKIENNIKSLTRDYWELIGDQFGTKADIHGVGNIALDRKNQRVQFLFIVDYNSVKVLSLSWSDTRKQRMNISRFIKK